MAPRIALTASLAVAILGGCGGSRSPSPEPLTAPVATSPEPGGGPVRTKGVVSTGPVVYVSDGDTIGVRLGGGVTRIRLLGIDAPETKDPNGAVECFGEDASALATLLLPKRMSVTVVTDPSQDERDRFGRLLAYVFRPGEIVPVNQRLVAGGAARVYVFRRNRPFRRVRTFQAAERDARAAGRGLWGSCP